MWWNDVYGIEIWFAQVLQSISFSVDYNVPYYDYVTSWASHSSIVFECVYDIDLMTSKIATFIGQGVRRP